MSTSAHPAPVATTRSRSHSLSLPSTSPIPLSSPLSPAALRFSELALSPPTSLQSDEFKRAYHHARSASFSGSVVPPMAPSSSLGICTDVASWAAGLSTSPTTTASTSGEDRLLTPSTSPTILNGTTTPPHKASSNTGRASSLKGVEGVIHEDDEVEFVPGGVEIVNPPTSASLFSNGARWGWPQATSAAPQTSSQVSSGSPPSPSRRASIGLAPEPSRSTYGMTAPLGRVVSAGATMGGSGKSEPFGLFRRLSVGGFGSKPKAPSPPPSVVMSPPTPAPLPPAPVAATSDPASTTRGRRASVGGASKPKRKLSPMGERMLRGGGFGH